MKITTVVDGLEKTLGLGASPLSNAVVSFALDSESGEADVARIGDARYSVLHEGRSYHVAVHSDDGEVFRVDVNGSEHLVEISDRRRWIRGRGGAGAEGQQKISAPMPGRVVKLLVQERDVVELDQGVIVVEAMKMQNEMKSTKTGKVVSLKVAEGESVAAGQILLIIE